MVFGGAIVASISWASSILLLRSCSFGPANKLLLGFKALPCPKNIIDSIGCVHSPGPRKLLVIALSSSIQVTELSLPRIKRHVLQL